MKGSIVGVIKGDTRSLDYSSLILIVLLVGQCTKLSSPSTLGTSVNGAAEPNTCPEP